MGTDQAALGIGALVVATTAITLPAFFTRLASAGSPEPEPGLATR
ncbi:hypothetical protein [Actinomadura barringtoniae]|nr:hypothetical protein [Actinomadura barringtoniae]